MKIRTCLLAAFGLVVPLIAMFSHLIPPGVSDAIWDATWQPASEFFAGDEDAAVENLADAPVASSRSFESSAEADAAQPENAAGASTAAGTAASTAPSSVVLPTVDIDTSRIADMPPAGMPPAAMSAARQPSFSAPPAELGQAAALEQPASPLWSTDPRAAASAVQPVAMATDASGSITEPAAQPAASANASPTGPSTALHTALEQLGAFGIDCQPTVGGRYFHCSCRIAADPTGQLVRMFHATETSPEQAMRQLLADVQQWQSQQTASTAVVPTSYGQPPLP